MSNEAPKARPTTEELQDRKKRELLQRFLSADPFSAVEGQIGEVRMFGDKGLRNGWEMRVYLNDKKYNHPCIEINVGQTVGDQRRFVHIEYGDDGVVLVEGNRTEFPVFFNESHSRLEKIRNAFKGGYPLHEGLQMKDTHLFTGGKPNPEIPLAIGRALANPTIIPASNHRA